eukprot:UN06051
MNYETIKTEKRKIFNLSSSVVSDASELPRLKSVSKSYSNSASAPYPSISP